MPSVLVLFAHPAIRRSRINRALRDAVTGLDRVEVHDLYEAYPQFSIDVAAEQARLVRHGAVVFQHPVYWYSCPAILKEWFDLVLQHGFAYGSGGNALAGKAWLSALSTGSDADSYQTGGLHGFTTEEILRPFEATAGLCRMRWQPPFITHDAVNLGATELDRAAAAYRQRVEALCDDREADEDEGGLGDGR